MPIPAKECIVTPPILQAAIPGYMRAISIVVRNAAQNIPVDAVIAIASADLEYRLRSTLIISRRSTDFPVPRRVMCPVRV